MSDNLHDCIYLSGPEFILLSTGAGLQQIDGLFRKPIEDLSDEVMAGALASLCSRGLMTAGEQDGKAFFQADRSLSDIFGGIRKADPTALFFEPGEETPKLLAYISDRTVAAQVSGADENAVRLFTMTFEEFVSWLKEEEFLPEQTQPGAFREEMKQAAGSHGVEVKKIDSDRYLCTGLE